MCLILLAYNNHPKYRAVIAANRDEFYERPTRAAQFWISSPELLAGKDLKNGGTWMGITRSGNFAAVTNYREPGSVSSHRPSRGFLVLDFLKQKITSEKYLKEIMNISSNYSGFNILLGTENDLWYYSNRGRGITKIKPGIHGLSNHLINTPWPKVEKGKQALSEIIFGQQPLEPEKIFTLLENRSKPPEHLLPATGVGLEWEKILSPIFVTSKIYGTRSSTILLWDHHGKIQFWERSFIMKENNVCKKETRRFFFEIEKSDTV